MHTVVVVVDVVVEELEEVLCAVVVKVILDIDVVEVKETVVEAVVED